MIEERKEMTQMLITREDAAKIRRMDYTMMRAEMGRKREQRDWNRKVAYYRHKHATAPEGRAKAKVLGTLAFLVLAARTWAKILKEGRL
jgi:hypothetical protein